MKDQDDVDRAVGVGFLAGIAFVGLCWLCWYLGHHVTIGWIE
jgi:hypothetical protein